VTRYLADGAVDFRIELPCTRATSLAFRGKTLFVTSAMSEISPSPDEAGGGLFAFDTEQSGPSSPRLSPSVLDRLS
jgi:sugar lactone lactonase YvrE